VERPYIENNGGQNRETERNKTTNEQKQAANNLHPTDHVNVAAIKKRFQVEAGHALWQGRHGKEMQERVRAEEDEDEPEKNAGDDR